MIQSLKTTKSSYYVGIFFSKWQMLYTLAICTSNRALLQDQLNFAGAVISWLTFNRWQMEDHIRGEAGLSFGH